jgi:hypothetical protein
MGARAERRDVQATTSGLDLSATCTYKDGIEDNGEEVKKRANTWTAIVASNVSPWAGVHEDFSAWPGEPGLACKSAPVSNALS